MQHTRPQLEDTKDLSPSASNPLRFFVADAEPIRFTFGAVSHIGKVRATNEDRYAIIKRTRASEVVASNVDFDGAKRQTDEAHLLVVADGIGGEAFGEFASEMAIKAAWEWAGRAASWVMKLRGLNAQQVQERVDAFVKVIQAEMAAHEDADPRLTGMGTTWTSAYLMNRDVVIAHLGDSRAYLFQKNGAVRITRDHTLAEDLIACGARSEDVVRFRSALTRALRGDRKERHPDVCHVLLELGDVLLLCSDGLTDVVSTSEIAQILKAHTDPQAACDALVERALAGGGPDNITILAAKAGQR